MFSETTRQVMFISGILLLHLVVVAMCVVGVIGRHSAFLWRIFCTVLGIGFHAATLFALVASDHGVSLRWAVTLIVAANTLVLLGWAVFFRQSAHTSAS